MQIKHIQSGVCLDQNLTFICLWIEGKKFRLFEVFADVINEWLLAKLFFATEYDFFFFASLLSAPS